MGLLDKRKTKIAERAAEHLEPGEQIVCMAMTNQAQNRKRGRNVAVAASDRNLYLFMISLLGITKIGKVETKIPLSEAEVTGDGDELYIGRSGGPDAYYLYPLLGAGSDVEELIAHVAAAGSPA